MTSHEQPSSSSHSHAQVPASSSNAPAPGERVGAFPYTVVSASGHDIEIPSGSTHTRSRSTPDDRDRSNIPSPPGLPSHISPTLIRNSQNTYSVRQEIAAIEQRLLMLRNMEQTNIMQLQQQQLQQNNTVNAPLEQANQQNNTFVQLNMHDPLSAEITLGAIQHAQQVTQSAQAQVQQTQAHAEHIAQLAQHEVARTQALAQEHVAQHTNYVENAAQQAVNEQVAALQARASQAFMESQANVRDEIERQRQHFAAEARSATEAARAEAHEAQRALEAHREAERIRNATPVPAQLFTPPARPPVFSPTQPATGAYQTPGTYIPPPPVPPMPFPANPAGPESYFHLLEGLMQSVHDPRHKVDAWNSPQHPASLA